MSKEKAFAIIAAIVIFLLAIVVALYFYLFSGSSSSSQTTQSNPGNSGRPVVINNQGGTATTTQSNQGGTLGPVPELRKISTTAVAGDVMFDVSTTTLNAAGKKQTTTETSIRYMEAATGHIFDTKTDTLVVTRLSTTDILGAYQALWTNDGMHVYTRYVDSNSTLDTYFGTLTPSPVVSSATSSANGVFYAPMQLKGSFLQNNILNIALSPASTALFTLTDTNGSGQGIISKIDGSQKVATFSSPLSEWITSWIATKTIALQTKASGTTSGYLYYLNTDTGLVSKVLGDIAGLVTLPSPDTKLVLYSASASGSIVTDAYNVATHTSAVMPIKTLPEKCVWSKASIVAYCAVPEVIPSGTYPDDWYQGNVSFTDDIWSINTKTGTTTVVAKPTDLEGVTIDATQLALDNKEDYLTFINKKDGILWGLQLTQ